VSIAEHGRLAAAHEAKYSWLLAACAILDCSSSRTNTVAGTKTGGKTAAATNEAREPGFYKRIGALGGAKGRTGGFYKNRELARIAGAKGGRISRRTKAAAK
jgi:uncharacterized protein